ncbi:hypothetical protein X735_11530 [Mesorhizobium sp. L2C085B000]|nr:hypothetical protein X735_11530 [Mesorhizobium sp. L2C085B000]
MRGCDQQLALDRQAGCQTLGCYQSAAIMALDREAYRDRLLGEVSKLLNFAKSAAAAVQT